MEKLQMHIEMDVYDSEQELSEQDRVLLQKAREASQSAYAPYSKFQVGAAVLLNDGTMVTGNNQENAAYPSGMCAERVAIFYARARFPEKNVVAVAVYAFSENFEVDHVLTPCGTCRQVMSEYEKNGGVDIRVILQSGKGLLYVSPNVRTFLPWGFLEEGLKGAK